MLSSEPTMEMIIGEVASMSYTLANSLRKEVLKIDDVQAEMGLANSHVQMLYCLYAQSPMRLSELSASMYISKSNIMPILNSLVERRYVQRRKDCADKRLVNIVLLPEGRAAAEKIQQEFVDNLTRWMGWEEDSVKWLSLQQMMSRLEAVLRREQVP